MAALGRRDFARAALPLSPAVEVGVAGGIAAGLPDLPAPGSPSAMLVDGGPWAGPIPPPQLPPRPVGDPAATVGAEGVPTEWLDVIQQARGLVVKTVEGRIGLLGGQASATWSGIAPSGPPGGPIAEQFRGIGTPWMRVLDRLLETRSAMRLEHARILALTAGRQDPAWRYRLNVSPRAVYRTEFRRCDLAYALEPSGGWWRFRVCGGGPLTTAGCVAPVDRRGVVSGFICAILNSIDIIIVFYLLESHVGGGCS